MENDETNTGESWKKQNNDYSHIKGWGIDSDPRNDPTYPMRIREDQQEAPSPRPTLQTPEQEVLHSVERPGLSATFGTSVPPKGLSGKIRRFAYKFSESNYARWMPLILADRVDAVENIFYDLRKGHIPNLFVERGCMAEWKYNRKPFLKKIAIGTVVATVVIAYCFSGHKKRKKQKEIYR